MTFEHHAADIRALALPPLLLRPAAGRLRPRLLEQGLLSAGSLTPPPLSLHVPARPKTAQLTAKYL